MIVKDPRFKSVDKSVEKSNSFSITDHSLKKENNVAMAISQLPEYTREKATASDNVTLRMNWRNTIPWRLECEQQGLGREIGYEQFKVTIKQSEWTAEILLS